MYWESHGIHTRLFYILKNSGYKATIPRYLELHLILGIDIEDAKKLVRYSNAIEAVDEFGLQYCLDYADMEERKRKERSLYLGRIIEDFKRIIQR